MRYFSETLDGEEIFEPDTEHGSVTRVNNPITIEWIADDKQEKPKEKIIEKLKNGSTIVERSMSNNGQWKIYDHRAGVKREFTNPEIKIPADFEKTRINHSVETVGIYHAFSPQEQERYDEWKAENKRKEQEAIAKQEFYEHLFVNKSLIKNLIEDVQSIGTLAQYIKDTDSAITELYESLPSNEQNNGSHHGVAKAYARRIKRGEITLEDVPESIREEVRRILEEEN